MSFIEAIVLGLVQGLTEFIPVSSSGHLLLGHEILGSSDATLGFDVALHVGTLVALLVYFRSDVWQLLRNVFAQNEHGRSARLIALATLPAIGGGLLFSDVIDENLRSPLVVAITLASVGVLMLLVDRVVSRDTKEISGKQGLLIGLAQTVALIPGVSRSGATITAGIALGLSRSQAARFSFLLAMPIVAGSALGILLKGDGFGGASGGVLTVGILTAFVSGLIAIKFMLSVITKVGLKPFAIYRIVLALIVLIFLV